MHFDVRRRGNHVVGGVRRQNRHRTTAIGHGFFFGERDLVGRHRTGRGKAVEHAVACLTRALEDR